MLGVKSEVSAPARPLRIGLGVACCRACAGELEGPVCREYAGELDCDRRGTYAGELR